MSDWKEDARVRRENAQRVVDELGLTITSEFVPFSRSRHTEPGEDGKVWKSLNWMVTLSKGTRKVLTTPYSAGTGHCPAYKNPPVFGCYDNAWSGARHKVDEGLRDRMVDWEIENGYSAERLTAGGSFARRNSKSKRIEPDALDVIYSLVMDADVLNHVSFADWAGDCGFDADRISHKEIYDTCLAHALALRGSIGDNGMAKLREAFEDW